MRVPDVTLTLIYSTFANLARQGIALDQYYFFDALF
jgi:hypothetical protein